MYRAPDPTPETLLPPILACLPTAFLSPRPPPALLPLLSPILRQRVTISANSQPPSSSTDLNAARLKPNWLHLLTWIPSRAEELAETVGNLTLEPHPVSGEIELYDSTDSEQQDGLKCVYRRLDQETLHAKCDVKLYNLSFIWLWCIADNGGTGLEGLSGLLAGGGTMHAGETKAEDAWRIAEVRPLSSDEEDSAAKQEKWYDTIKEADEAFEEQGLLSPGISSVNGSVPPESDDGDSYWAAYDQTPGQSRAASVSAPTAAATAVPPSSTRPSLAAQRNPSTSGSDSYWGRYDQVPSESRRPSQAPSRQQTSQPGSARPSSISRNTSTTELDHYARYEQTPSPESSRRPSSALPARTLASARPPQPTSQRSKPTRQVSASGDDASYWAQYDATPSTSRRPSRNPTAYGSGLPRAGSTGGGSEADYYARYANEVQPAMDPHDPDEEAGMADMQSSLQDSSRAFYDPVPPPRFSGITYTTSRSGVPEPVAEEDHDHNHQANNGGDAHIHSPSPERPGSAAGSVQALEREAQTSSVVEAGIKQHISTEIKSLFMLSQKVGIERSEFERLVRRELEVLGLIEL